MDLTVPAIVAIYILTGLAMIGGAIGVTQIAPNEQRKRITWIGWGLTSVIFVLQTIGCIWAVTQYRSGEKQAAEELRHASDARTDAAQLLKQTNQALLQLNDLLGKSRRSLDIARDVQGSTRGTLTNTRALIQSENALLNNSERLMFPLAGVYVAYAISFRREDVLSEDALHELRNNRRTSTPASWGSEKLPLSAIRPDVERFLAHPALAVLAVRYPGWLPIDLRQSQSSGAMVSLVDFARAEIAIVPYIYSDPSVNIGTGETAKRMLLNARLEWVTVTVGNRIIAIWRCEMTRHQDTIAIYYTFTMPRDITRQDLSDVPTCARRANSK